MNRKRIILGLGVLFILILIVWAVRGGQQRFSWRETFKIDSKEPYGLYGIYEILDDYAGVSEMRTLEDSLAGQLPTSLGDGPANYVFVGGGLFMREQDRDELLAFVSVGNTAFLSTKVLPYDLMFYLYYDECDYIPWDGLSMHMDTTIGLNFVHPSLKRAKTFDYKYVQNFATVQRQWQYFPETYLCEQENGLVPIGETEEGLVNMVQIPYGEGFFYLHSQPLVFTNYHLINEEGRDYVQRALSHLEDGPVYWDEFSRVPERMARRQNQEFRGSQDRRLREDSPLQYILEQPPLAWAWYTLMAMGLLYMLFRAKRRQRVIPVYKAPRNTSMQFLETIGFLYYQKASHQQVAVQAIKLLRTFVKERYGLQWRDQNEAFIQQLSNRAGVDQELVASIAKDAHNIPRYTGLVETELVKFHQRLERFYQAAK